MRRTRTGETCAVHLVTAAVSHSDVAVQERGGLLCGVRDAAVARAWERAGEQKFRGEIKSSLLHNQDQATPGRHDELVLQADRDLSGL